jgi:hypothetical protein
MASTTKLHRLLSRAKTWDGDLRYDVEDYLEANCTVQEILRLCVLTAQEHVVPPNDPLNKVELLTDLLPRVSPSELLAAWDELLVERADTATADRP